MIRHWSFVISIFCCELFVNTFLCFLQNCIDMFLLLYKFYCKMLIEKRQLLFRNKYVIINVEKKTEKGAGKCTKF